MKSHVQQELVQCQRILENALANFIRMKEMILDEIGNDDAKTLKDYIGDVLSNSNEPLTAKEVADLVLESGYRTVSGNFPNIVLHTLTESPEFTKATRNRRPARFRNSGVSSF